MADYFTSFSCVLPVGGADNAARAVEIYRELERDLARDEQVEIGFAASVDDLGSLWIRDEHGFGDPEHVITFVLRCAEALDLTARWGFAWALTCSKPHLGGFGGGAQLLDLGRRESIGWIDCSDWLATRLVQDGPPPP